jgi:GMP synthase (glutamine-hydrolysing)
MNTDIGQTRIALLDASVGDTPAEANVRRELDAAVTAFKVSEGAMPPSAETAETWPFDAAVISGSQTAVYDDEPWIETVTSWTSEAVEAGIPILGVCWGHQLLAQAVGGYVDPMGRYELGYQEVDRIAADPLFSGIDETFLAFETHSDEVTRLPGDATILAENDRSLQAFRIENAWGVQFHPEYDRETARWVTENKRGDVDDAELEAVLDGITQENAERAREAKLVFENFLEVAARTAIDA